MQKKKIWKEERQAGLFESPIHRPAWSALPAPVREELIRRLTELLVQQGARKRQGGTGHE
jgi:hypothetical protein